ncbi:ABC multidrug transporter [Blastomyces dermatitidis ER-3]|uniref:ABC multidrug transporter n=1 Tax=Ajellomyces dermatitidis (strain ER-3 / ATCC MYA-2586) TaxID=559297 RepID=A0ABP2F2Y1_AJEDR|nr:ABC multidrug transporter [Blastomyces dermatitidis ER-3]EEQ91210.2 ABC multidrug transporter [Blastomyces dermatitidis ER-3]
MDNNTTQAEAEKQQSEPEQKPPFKNFWRILGHGTLLDKILMGIATLCAAGAGTALPLMNIVFGNVVSNFNRYFIPGSGVSKEEFLSSANESVLYIVYLFIGKFLLGYISMFCLRMTGIRISARLRLSYLQALFNQPISVFDTLPPGRPTNTITTSSNTIQAGISDKLAILVQSLALVIGAYSVAFRYSWSLTLVASASILFISIVYGALIPIYIKLQKKVEQADEKASSIAGEALGSIRTIVSCCAEGRLAARYGEWVAESRKRGMRLAPQIGAQLAPSNFAMYSSFALTFWFGVRQFASKNIPDVGPVITVIFSVLIVVSTLSFVATPIIAVSKAVSASTYFFEMIDAPKPKTSGLKDQDVATTDIRFEDVNFSYPSRSNVKIINNMTLDIPAGKITALVGPSGCGKSTIVALLERWYQIETQFEGDATPKSHSPQSEEDPQKEKEQDTEITPNSGSIKIGPHDLYDLDLKWWRSQIGLVQQEPFTFNTTIYQNVAYGLVGSRWENESEEVKRELVKEACREAFASEYIEKLPLGYDTMVGENGLKLSGGQRQRLAIARSIIKRPPILILDEATSSIDVRGERIVQEALDRVSKNRTTITIAHRLSTIKKADKIIVLKGGESIEQGTHEKLLEFKGLYHSLVENQRLEMGDHDTDVQGDAHPKSQVEDIQTLLQEASRVDTVGEPDQEPEPTYKARSLFNSVGLFLWEQRKLWYLDVAIVIGAAGCGSAFAIQSYIFAQLTAVFQLSGDELINRSEFWSLMFFILALCVGLFYFILGFASTSLSAYICGTYRQEYFENIITKPIHFFDEEGNSTGSLAARVSTDPTQLQELVGHQMAFPLISVFNIMGCISVAFFFGWKLTLVAIFSAFPLIIIAMFIRVRYEVQFEKMNAAVFESSSQFASEAISAFRTVTSLTLEDTITTRYSNLLQDHVTKAFKKARFATLIFAAADSIELPCMALCFWYGAQLLSTYEYDVLRFMVIYIAVVMGGQAAGQFGSVTPNIAQATGAANRILSVRPSQGNNDGEKKTVGRFEGGAQIDFKSINFKYPTRDITVFKNLSFTIEKGQFAALVGPSGCGKSTVIGLLEKFYEYQSGTITIDGHDLHTLDVSSYRQSVSLVSQEPALYQGSIKDNVLLGVDPTQFTDEDVQKACKDANIHDFIISLPDGYNTDVGLRGLAMSGGQKQRICIARALIRNPSILLLDEATSSLDSESEKHVQEAIERTAKGRTVVVVAHRLATVQNADVIFVFGEGGILEVGTHANLLKQRGTYYQMCESQALDR